MTSFDYGVLLILGASVAIGMFRGLLKEVLSLAAYAVAFVVAIRFGALVYGWLEPTLETPGLRLVVAYGGLFVATLLVVGLLNMALAAAVKAAGLSLADFGLGALFGLARGMLIVLVLVVAAGFTPLPQEPWWKEAVLSPYAESGARAVKPYLPEQFADWVRY